MAERCIDANIAVKWLIKGEAFRRLCESLHTNVCGRELEKSLASLISASL